MTTAVYLQNALVPQARQVIETQPASIHALAPHHWQTPYVAFVDGQPVLRRDWGRVVDGGNVTFIDVAAIPQGGGGGSDPLRMVIMLAAVVYAPQIAANMIYGDGIAAAAALGGSGLAAFNAASVFVGISLVNAILPPPKPPSPQIAAAMAAPSPTYSLQAQGNSARLESAIPEHFGRLAAYPDFSAQPYVEYSGNEQFLYQVLCIGRGEYAIEQIRVEDTDIVNFDDVSYEVVPPGQAISMFPSAVITSVEVSGQEIMCAAGSYSQSGTVVTVTLASHGFQAGNTIHLQVQSGSLASGAYSVQSVVDVDHFTLTATSATTSGNCTASRYIGGFVASAGSDADTTFLGIDYVMPRGIYHVSDSGALDNVSITVQVEVRRIDATGAPLGSWTIASSQTFTAATTTPQRYSERIGVSAGRYEVRVTRLDAKQTDTRYGHEVVWGGLRAYLVDVRTFGDVTLLAMRLRASNNLSLQASRKINVICTRKLPVWDGSSWSAPQATRSIAWAFAYACKQIGMSDAQIDLAALRTLDAVWSARGDSFDGRFDNFLSFWEAITKIAAAGRAKPFMQGGIVRIRRDQQQTLPVAMFTTRNIVKGSFSIEYLMPTADTADSVEVSYIDSNTWTPARVTAQLPGSTASRAARVDLFGVVRRDQAFREGMYQAASNRYRRKMIKFSTEMEGFIPSLGDLIAVSHDMPAWGQSGEVTGWNATTKIITLSEPVQFGSGTHYLALRKRDGSVGGPYIVTSTANANQLYVSSALSFTPYTGGSEERTHYSFGWANTYYQRALVVQAQPSGLHSVAIQAVAEDDNVHTAELGVTTPSMAVSQLANYVNAPRVQGLIARSMPDAPERMLITWQPSPWAEHYLVEQSSGDGVWTRVGQTSTANFAAIALYGSATMIRVAAVGLARGPWVTIAYGSSADYMWAATDTTLMWSTTTSNLMWRY